jgi:hypothetical protein
VAPSCWPTPAITPTSTVATGSPLLLSHLSAADVDGVLRGNATERYGLSTAYAA